MSNSAKRRFVLFVRSVFKKISCAKCRRQKSVSEIRVLKIFVLFVLFVFKNIISGLKILLVV